MSPARCRIDSPSKARRLFFHRTDKLQGVAGHTSFLAPTKVFHPNMEGNSVSMSKQLLAFLPYPCIVMLH